MTRHLHSSTSQTSHTKQQLHSYQPRWSRYPQPVISVPWACNTFAGFTTHLKDMQKSQLSGNMQSSPSKNPVNLKIRAQPITLLCPACKGLRETSLNQNIHPYIILCNTHHGFHPGHSTTTSLFPLDHQIAEGFKQHYPIHSETRFG